MVCGFIRSKDIEYYSVTHISDCYRYTINRLEELGASYVEQVNRIEDFALWNLPYEFADDWDNMNYFIDILYCNKKIDDTVKSILDKIRSNFTNASQGQADYNPDIWTHDGMRIHEFWSKQRMLAKEALQLMSESK